MEFDVYLLYLYTGLSLEAGQVPLFGYFADVACRKLPTIFAHEFTDHDTFACKLPTL